MVLTHRGSATLDERRRAALVYSGAGARLSGHHALDLWGVLGRRIEVGPQILVVPHDRHRTSSGFCVVERSERPVGRAERGGLPVTSAVRAATDACRRQDVTLDDVREILGALLRGGHCTLKGLDRAVRTGPTQRSALMRAVLGELGAGIRSAAEGKALRVIARSSLPRPEWNVDVVVDGRWIGEADAYWPELGVVLEIDSMLWHLGARDLRRTQEKARRYAEANIVLVSIAPADVVADPAALLRTLDRALAARAASRPAR